MNHYTTSSYALTASAFILSALILMQASRWIENQAQAEMVVSQGSITLITTQFEGDSEILYVLDSAKSMLFAYLMNRNRSEIQLMGRMDIEQEFVRGFGAAAVGGSEREAPRKR